MKCSLNSTVCLVHPQTCKCFLVYCVFFRVRLDRFYPYPSRLLHSLKWNTTFSAASDENIIKMTLLFPCIYTFYGIIFYTASDNCCHGKQEVQEMTWLSQTILTGIFPSSTQLITIDGICSVTTEICRVANGPECLPTARINIWASWKDE